LGESYNFEYLKIPDKYVSLVASGISVLDLTQADLNFLKEKTFFISTNFPLAIKEPTFVPDAHIWCDTKTSLFMEEHYAGKAKDCIWMSRPLAFDEKHKKTLKVYKQVDYWMDDIHYKLNSHFTFSWTLQLLRRFFPDKIVLLFGFDGYIPESTPCHNKDNPYSKWYDYYTKKDIDTRTFQTTTSSIDLCVEHIQEMWQKQKSFAANVINCNVNSRVKYIPKQDFREVLK